jgi:hypothetical protein
MPLVTSHMHRKEALWKSFTMICWYPPHPTNKEKKEHTQPTHQFNPTSSTSTPKSHHVHTQTDKAEEQQTTNP